MRASGNAFLFGSTHWKDFWEYEEGLNEFLSHKPMTVLCTYSLPASSAGELLDISPLHHFSIATRNGSSTIIQPPGAIPERNRVEGLLRKANEQVEMVLDSISDRFFAFDREWRCTFFNKHAEEQLRALGKNPASLIGKVLWDEFPKPPTE